MQPTTAALHEPNVVVIGTVACTERIAAKHLYVIFCCGTRRTQWD